MKTHNLSKKEVYPQKHRFKSNPKTMNLFSSAIINNGDFLLYDDVKLLVVNTDKIEEKANYLHRANITHKHSFYVLKVEEVK